MKTLKNELTALRHPDHGMRADFSITKKVIRWAMGPTVEQVKEVCDRHGDTRSLERAQPWNLNGMGTYYETHAEAYLASRHLWSSDKFNDDWGWSLSEIESTGGFPMDEMADIAKESWSHDEGEVLYVPEAAMYAWVDFNYPEGSTELRRGDFYAPYDKERGFALDVLDLSVPENAAKYRADMDAYEAKKAAEDNKMKRSMGVLSAKDVRKLLNLEGAARKKFLTSKFDKDIAAEILE